MVAGNQNWNTQVQGTDVDYPLIRAWPTAMGAYFTPQDVTTANKVVVLGASGSSAPRHAEPTLARPRRA